MTEQHSPFVDARTADQRELEQLRAEVAALKSIVGAAMPEGVGGGVSPALQAAGAIKPFNEMITVHAPDGTYVWVSSGAERLLGFTPEELLGRDPYDLIHPQDIPVIEQAHRSLLDHPDSTVRVVFRMQREDGEEVWLETFARSIAEEEGGAARRLVAYSREVTDQVQASGHAAGLERRYRVLLEATQAIAWEVDPATFNFKEVDASTPEILGYPRERWLSPNFWVEHVHPEDRDRAVDFCKAKTAAGRDHEFTYRMLGGDGTIRWIRDYVRLVTQDGKVSLLHGALVDITDLHERDEIARLRNKAVSRLLGSYGGILYRRADDDAWTLEYVTDGCQKLTGYRPIDLLYSMAARYIDIVHPEDLVRVVGEFARARDAALEHLEIRYRVVAKDGSVRNVLDLADITYLPDGNIDIVEGMVLVEA